MKPNLQQLLDDPIIRLLLNWASKLNQPLYLVGGYLRDFLLGRQNPEPDLDLVAKNDFQILAKDWADQSGGSLVRMDDNTHRVLFQWEGRRWQWDFAGFRAPTIEEDLGLRDFTVNAIAWPVGAGLAPAPPEGDRKGRPYNFTPSLGGRHTGLPLLDPTSGLSDLANKVLRIPYDRAFQDDSLRLLRAGRFAAQLGFTLEPATREKILQEKNLLKKAAGERIREEFFKTLAQPGAERHIKLLDELGLLPVLIPEVEEMKLVKQGPPHYLPLWEHSLEALRWMETIIERVQGFKGSRVQELNVLKSLDPSTPRPLEPYLESLQLHYQEPIESAITRRELILLAALFHDIGKPATQTFDEDKRPHFYDHQKVGEVLIRRLAKDFKLGNRAKEILTLAVRGHMRPFYLTEGIEHPEEVTPRARSRFFRQLGEAGLDVLLISLADLIATYGPEDKEDIDFHLRFIEMMMEHYFGRHIVTQKEPLLLGRDLLEHFRLSPGPFLGFLLDKVSEAQEEGVVKSKDEALKYLEENLGEWEEEYKKL